MKATYVEILSKSKAKIVPYVVFGVVTTLYGFGVYYLLPLSLLSFNLGLILQVFFFILLGFLLGLILGWPEGFVLGWPDGWLVGIIDG